MNSIFKTNVLDEIGYIELLDMMPHELGTAEAAVVSAARTSYLSDSKGPEKDKKLLWYLLKHKHTSPMEQVQFKFRINAPLIVWWQLVRHRTQSLNLQCLAGDTEITFNRPSDWKRGKHRVQSTWKGEKFTIKYLYDLWSNSVYKSRIEKMFLRVYDEAVKEFTVSTIKNVFKSGIKPVFKVTTRSGYTVQCSKDHRFLTNDGWKTLEEAVGLKLFNKICTIQNQCYIFVNGVSNAWQSYDWMKEKRVAGLSVSEIAAEGGCSYHTVRKWLKIHDLKFDQSKTQFKKGNKSWNTGLHYDLNLTQEQRERRKEISKNLWVKRGQENHHWWKGGISSDRENIGRWTTQHAKEVHAKNNYTCQYCGEKSSKLHAHHVKPVVNYPELAKDISNLTSVCIKCHRLLHGQNSETANIISVKNKAKQKLFAKLDQIISVDYIGEIETYDIEVNGDNKNFIANGIIVHNSGRYSEFDENQFYVPLSHEWRLQSQGGNKQMSDGFLDVTLGAAYTDQMNEIVYNSYKLYNQMLHDGVAREQARLVLPGFASYYLGITSINAHNLIHFLRLRLAKEAQYEIRAYARAQYEMFKKVMPWTAEYLETNEVSPWIENGT